MTHTRHLLTCTLIIITFILLKPTIIRAQNNIENEKILLVINKDKYQRQVLLTNDSLKKVSSHTYIVGDRVVVRKYSDNVKVTGHIELISDSSITIKGIAIKLNEIECICVYRGVEESIIGASMFTAGTAGFIIFFDLAMNNKYNTDNIALPLLSIALFLAGGCTTIYGIIAMIATKHYRMNENYMLTVITKKNR